MTYCHFHQFIEHEKNNFRECTGILIFNSQLIIQGNGQQDWHRETYIFWEVLNVLMAHGGTVLLAGRRKKAKLIDEGNGQLERRHKIKGDTSIIRCMKTNPKVVAASTER